MMNILVMFFAMTLKDELEKVKYENIKHLEEFGSLLSLPSFMQGEVANERFEIEGVHSVCYDLLEKLELCLIKLESEMRLVHKESGQPISRF